MQISAPHIRTTSDLEPLSLLHCKATMMQSGQHWDAESIKACLEIASAHANTDRQHDGS